MSEIRYDRLHDTSVIIAPERLHRPRMSLEKEQKNEVLEVCPFCEGNEKLTPPEIFALRKEGSFENEQGWKTRVVPNLYKAVQIETPHKHHYGIFEHWEGFGAHEVLIDTAKHTTSMTQWNEQNVCEWLKTLQQRVNDLRQDSRIASLSIFKNEGAEAGGTQAHCHTQIIGLPIIAKSKKEQYQRVYEHYKHNQNSLIALLVQEELDSEENRIITKNEKFTAFCPYASAHPFEILISSTEALGEIENLSDDTMQILAPLLLDVLKRLKKQLISLDFNLIVSCAPFHENGFGDEFFSTLEQSSRFYIHIIPRIYTYGGFEQETGIFINPVVPELAAKLLRENYND